MFVAVCTLSFAGVGNATSLALLSQLIASWLLPTRDLLNVQFIYIFKTLILLVLV